MNIHITRLESLAPKKWWAIRFGRWTLFVRKDPGKRFPVLVEWVKDYNL